MKRLTLLIALSLNLLMPEMLQAQSKKFYKRETALIFYDFYIEGSLMQQFEQYSDLFRPCKEEKRNPIKNQLLYTSWDMIREALEDQTGMLIVPMDAYGSRFTYDDYGFPNMGINKALKKGASKYYLRFDISLKPTPTPVYTTSTKPDSLAMSLTPGQILPILTIDVTIYPDKGVLPTSKSTITIKAQQPFEVNEALFDGFVNDKETVSAPPTNIYGMFKEAIVQLGGSIFAGIR